MEDYKVTSLHKGADFDDLSNNCPISVLPVLSKVVEGHVHDALYKYPTDNQLIYPRQSRHVDNECRKLSHTGLLRKIRRIMSLKQRIIYYNSMIKPVLGYVNVIWPRVTKTILVGC